MLLVVLVQFSDIKLIVFDFDGTLAKTTKYAKRFFEKTMKHEMDVKKYFGPPTKVMIKNLIKDYNLKISEEQFYNDWAKNYLDYVSKRKIITKTTINAIKKLKTKGYKLAIITSSKRKKLKILMPQNFYNLFDLILGSEDYLAGKPNPESLNKLLKIMKTNHKNCVYIGDNIRDIEFAKKANVFSIGKEDYLYSEKELSRAGADKTIKSIKDLFKLI